MNTYHIAVSEGGKILAITDSLDRAQEQARQYQFTTGLPTRVEHVSAPVPPSTYQIRQMVTK